MKKNVAIGIITCNRPEGLRTLLLSLAKQEISKKNASAFNWYIIVVDNDLSGLNLCIVQEIQNTTNLKIVFVEEAISGIPFARNRSLITAGSCDAFIFIDDDEIAPPNWLDALLSMYSEYSADVITGPVQAVLPDNAPSWAQKSKIFNKNTNTPRGGLVPIAYTNNTLISKRVIEEIGATFDPRFQFTGSSDLHYFLRVRNAGFSILWCPEALLKETVPLSRIKYDWILKRGFRSGSGETYSHLFIQPGTKSVIGVLLRAFARLSIGTSQIILAPLTGWRGFILGSKRISSGLGCLAGLLGKNYDEYKTLHGS